MHPLQGAGREGQRGLPLAVLGLVVAADQAAKLVIERRIPLGASRIVLPGLLTLTHVHNRGIAFSVLGGIPVVVPAAIALTLLFILFYNRARWVRDPGARAGLALLCGGALGNVIDRLRVGAVVDYIDLQVWPVFNLADVAVTAGAAVLILTMVLRPGRLARRDR